MTRETDDLAAELKAIADAAHIFGTSMMEGDTGATPEAIGSALFSIACHLERIADDLAAVPEQ